MAPVETSQASQSTTLSAPRRHDGLCSDETTGPDRLVTRRGTTCACSRRESLREPDAGNPHVRFDEGRGADLFFFTRSLSYSTATRVSQGCGRSWVYYRCLFCSFDLEVSTGRSAGRPCVIACRPQ